MIGIVHVNAFVVGIDFSACASEGVCAMEYRIARIRFGFDSVEQCGKRHTCPFADGTPAFDTIVPCNLGARGHCPELVEAEFCWLRDQTVDFECPLCEACLGVRLIGGAIRIDVAIAAKAGREIGLGEFLRH